MKFINIQYLWLALSVAIPIVVHLFYFKRYKKIDFTMVQLLKSFQQQGQSQKKLKQLLILISRIAMLLFLVLAFAQPYFLEDKIVKDEAVIGIYIDNSYSLSSTDGNERYNLLKQSALSLIDHFEQQSFMIVANQIGPQTKTIYDAHGAKKYLRSLNIEGSNLEYDEIINAFASAENMSKVYMYSDFQKSLAIEANNQLPNFSVHWVPLSSQAFFNVSIDSMWLSSPFIDKSQAIEIVFKLQRNFEQSAESQKVNLHVNGLNKGFVNVGFENNRYAFDTIKTQLNEGGIYTCQLITDDDGMLFDNTFNFVLNVSDVLNVLTIKDNSSIKSLDRFFNSFKFIDHDTLNHKKLDYASLSNYDVIILHEIERFSSGMIASLQSLVQQGQDLVIIPSKKSDLIQYNSLAKALNISSYKNKVTQKINLEKTNLNASIFKSVFERSKEINYFKMPDINWYYPLQNKSIAEPLIYNQNNHFYQRIKKEKANIYQFSFGFESANNSFIEHAIFPVCMYNMLIESKDVGKLYYNTNQSQYLKVGSKDIDATQAVKIKHDQGQEIFAKLKKIGGEQILSIDTDISKDGFYKLINGESELFAYAINVDRKESNLAYYTLNELESFSQKRNIILTPIDANMGLDKNIESSSISLWKVCLILALLFLLIEILILKFF